MSTLVVKIIHFLSMGGYNFFNNYKANKEIYTYLIIIFLYFYPVTFANCGEEQINGALWLQDGDPRQNSKVARQSWERLGCKMFGIPARSPDLNPIENIFHTVRKQLKQDALDRHIRRENYQQFCERIHSTIMSTSLGYINNTIASLPARMLAVVRSRGGRTKY